MGSSVGKGWKVEAMGAVKQGACVLSLKHKSGEVTNIHICAKEKCKRLQKHGSLGSGRDGWSSGSRTNTRGCRARSYRTC